MATKKEYIKHSSLSRGKVIAFGSSGCVFYPALKCDGRKASRNIVSKLMRNREANKEYENIMHIRSKVSEIPNYEDYFLLDVVKCKPKPLTEHQLKELSICKSLFPEDINESINDFTVLNMPNGGQPIDDFIYDSGSFEKIYEAHTGLAKLLVNGIIPMNKLNIYHCDIKDSNVLINTKVMLIDWGLYVEYESNGSFPQMWRNRPLQYNVPFSIILFTDVFIQKYAKFKSEEGDYTEAKLQLFVVKYVMQEMKAKHYDFIKEIMKLLLLNSGHLEESEIEAQTLEYIVNYIVKILVHFKEDWFRIYLDNVFTKNVDIWGFIIAYYPILEVLSSSYSKLTAREIKIFNQLQFIFVNYLYEPEKPYEPIDMDELFVDLEILGKLIYFKINGGSYTSYESPFPLSEK